MPRQGVQGSEAAGLPVPPGWWPDGSGRVSRSSPIPLHVQFRHLLLGMIERGEVRPGETLPTERDLAQRYDVSLAPVRQAILDLAREGVLHRVRGQGTFVRGRRVVESVSHLASFTETMRAKGFSVEVQVLRAETVPTPPAVAEGLALREQRVV